MHGNQHDNSSLSIGRVTAGIEFSRPLRPKWSGTAGLIFQVWNVHSIHRFFLFWSARCSVFPSKRSL